MSRINVKPASIYTHEGAKAKHINPEQALRRSVMSCFLWEKEFYEDGEDIASRIQKLANQVDPQTVMEIAYEARTVAGLRHVPLLLLLNLVERRYGMTANAIAATINRADEITELLAMYWRNGKKPIANQLKQGLSLAFHKFDEYQFAKYNRDGAVKLVDVERMVRPNPKDAAEELQEAKNILFGKIRTGTLATPDTWEVELSAAGSDPEAKRAVWERLLGTNKLGYMALLRNLRNMAQVGVSSDLINEAILARKGARWVLPFRYTAAARIMPQFEPALDKALIASLEHVQKLPGKTIVLVDVSGSMDVALSARSDMKRVDAAATLASIIVGDKRVFSFSHNIVEVPARMGMAGVDAIIKSQPHGGTYLGQAIANTQVVPHDRLIVITDEQAKDRVPDPVVDNAYIINVASNQNGVGYGKWVHIDGFSENVIRFIAENENLITSSEVPVIED